MQSRIMIKSFTNGLKIYLDNECDFAEIIAETTAKFSESKKFFNGGKVAVSFEGRTLTKDEESSLIRAMEEAADMSILYVIGNDPLTNESFTKAVSRPMQNCEDIFSVGKVYAGSLKRGDKLETESSIVIVGDVEPGAKITAGGNIIILGGLYGTAVCNSKKDSDKCFIATMDLSAEDIQIGTFHYYSKEKSKWVVKPKMIPKIAYVSNHQVIVENTGKDVISKLCNIINQE